MRSHWRKTLQLCLGQAFSVKRGIPATLTSLEERNRKLWISYRTISSLDKSETIRVEAYTGKPSEETPFSLVLEASVDHKRRPSSKPFGQENASNPFNPEPGSLLLFRALRNLGEGQGEVYFSYQRTYQRSRNRRSSGNYKAENADTSSHLEERIFPAI